MNLNFFGASNFPLIPLASAEEETFSPETEKEWLQGISEHPQYQVKILKDVTSKWYWIPLFFTGIGALFVFYKFVVKLHFHLNCAKISVVGANYYLSIKNIAKKTLLDRSQIIEHEKNGTLWTVLKNKICALDFTNNSAFEQLPEKVKEVFLQTLPNIVKNKGLVQEGGTYYIAQYNTKRALTVLKFSEDDPTIANGGCAIVKLVEDMTLRRFLVMKTRHDHDISNQETQGARADLNPKTRAENDQKYLEEMLSNQRVLQRFNTPPDAPYGIQEPAEMSINIDLTDGRKILATIEKEYTDGDLFNCLKNKKNFPTPMLLRLAINTLKALSLWWKSGKPHGDIKPENICLDDDKIRLIDLPSEDAIENLVYIYSPECTAQQDFEEISKLRSVKPLPEGSEREKFNALYMKKLFKTDVFAAGVTLYHILSNGKEPFLKFEEDQFIRSNQFFDPERLRSMNYSDDLRDALLELLRADPNDRINIERVTSFTLARLEAELKRHSN